MLYKRKCDICGKRIWIQDGYEAENLFVCQDETACRIEFYSEKEEIKIDNERK